RNTERHSSSQPRHAVGAYACGGAPLPRRISLGSPRHLAAALVLAADPARHRAQPAPGALGREIRLDLDCRRLAARRAYRPAGKAAFGKNRASSRIRDALWRASHRPGEAIRPGGSALSAIL